MAISRISGRADVVEILTFLKKATEGSRVELDVSDVGQIYPNGAVPLAAIVEHFRSSGIEVNFVGTPPGRYFEHARIRNPLLATPTNLNHPAGRLDTVWAYDAETVFGLAKCIIEELAEKVEFSDGVLNALNWCLFEVLDNVFEHSDSTTGYFMGQVLKSRRRLLFCIADSGIGIHRSFFRSGRYRPPTPLDALTLAVREGVTSTNDKRGNGLFGLKGVIEHNGGRLEITSGRGVLRITPSGIEGNNLPRSIVIDADHHCTVVDFELDVSQPVDLNEVLGIQLPDMRLEAIESDVGEHVIALREHAQGTGTRQAAERLRNFLMNYLNEGARYLVLDFEGVTMVSSSFADETIGKLAERFGLIGFTQRFRLINMSQAVQSLLDRAIALRISSNYYIDDRQTPTTR